MSTGLRRAALAAMVAAAGMACMPQAAAQASAPTSAWPAGQGAALSVYGGWRSGGSFTDVATGQTVSTDPSGSFAASIERRLDAMRQVQVFVSHQGSRLVLPAGGTVSVGVTHLHLGGTNYFEGPVGSGPYLSGGLGLSVFSPGLSGLSTEFRPSISLGIGWQVPLGASASLRLEARGYAVLVNSSGEFFCSGGCVVSLRGDTYTQGEVLLGVSFGF
jgi:hypothetical protein